MCTFFRKRRLIEFLKPGCALHVSIIDLDEEEAMLLQKKLFELNSVMDQEVRKPGTFSFKNKIIKFFIFFFCLFTQKLGIIYSCI